MSVCVTEEGVSHRIWRANGPYLLGKKWKCVPERKENSNTSLMDSALGVSI